MNAIIKRVLLDEDTEYLVCSENKHSWSKYEEDATVMPYLVARVFVSYDEEV